MKILYVGAKTDPKKLAKAITQNIIKFEVVEVQAIGAAAVNQTVKAVAISRNAFKPRGGDLICAPSFKTVTLQDNNSETSAILFTVGKA